MQAEDGHRGRTMAYVGLAVMFVLIGSAVLQGAVYYSYPFGFSSYWFWPMVGLFFSMWALASFVFRPWRARYVYGGRRWRDPSPQILRERHARGR